MFSLRSGPHTQKHTQTHADRLTSDLIKHDLFQSMLTVSAVKQSSVFVLYPLVITHTAILQSELLCFHVVTQLRSRIALKW